MLIVLNGRFASCMVQFVNVWLKESQNDRKQELALKHGKGLEVQPLLNLLNSEATALSTLHQDNSGVLNLGAQQIKQR